MTQRRAVQTPRKSARRTKAPLTSASQLLALLDWEEQAVLLETLALSSPDEVDGLPVTDVLRRVLEMKTTFVRMLAEIAGTVELLGARARSSLSFVSIPRDDDAAILLACGPQMRTMIATALDPTLVADNSAALVEKINALDRMLRSTLLHIRPVPVGPGPLRQLLEMRARLAGTMFPENFPLPDDVIGYTKQHQASLEHLTGRVERLVEIATKGDGLQDQTILRLLERLEKSLRQESAHVHGSTVDDGVDPDLRKAVTRWDAQATVVEEALLQCSSRQDALDAIYDLLSLEIWKDRARLYELWVLCWSIRRLVDAGFELEIDPSRIADGVWQLKFVHDSIPVCWCRFGDLRLAIYYQLFSSNGERNDMPDIAVRVDEAEYLVVLDPKYYETPKVGEFAKVCKRYADDYESPLTAVVGYRHRENAANEVSVDGPGVRLVVHGVQPGSDTARRLARVFDTAIRDALVERGLLPRRGIVLFDVSGSTAPVRAAMLADLTGRAVVQVPPDTVVVPFDDDVHPAVPFGEVDLLDTGGSGTDLGHAVESVLARLADAEPAVVWIYADSEALGNGSAVRPLLDDERVTTSLVIWGPRRALPELDGNAEVRYVG